MKKDWEIYAEKYAVKHGISVEEAKTHRVVQDYHNEVGERVTDSTGRDLKTE